MHKVTLLLDISVLAHTIAWRFSNRYQRQLKHLRSYCFACIHRIASGLTLLNGEIPVPVEALIGCVDQKIPKRGYWRNEYLLPLGIEYKGTRDKGKSSYVDILATVKGHLTEAVNEVGVSVTFAGYEADDVASYFVRSLPKETKLALLTVDSDWLGLLEEGRSCWVAIGHCREPYVSRIDQLQDKLKDRTEYQSFPQVWVEKSRTGDRSDNLPAGSPIEVIDLLNPPAQFDLVKLNQGKPDAAIQTHRLAKSKVGEARGIQASTWLKRNNLWFAPQTVYVRENCPLFGG